MSKRKNYFEKQKHRMEQEEMSMKEDDSEEGSQLQSVDLEKAMGNKKEE